MTKKSQQKFWQIKRNFFGENVLRKSFPRFSLTCCSETKGECFIGSGRWMPLVLSISVYHSVTKSDSRPINQSVSQVVSQLVSVVIQSDQSASRVIQSSVSQSVSQ